MIPRTYPSVYVDGVSCCVISVITPEAGQRAWVDYIPVKSADVITAKVNRYDTDGAIAGSVLDDTTGKVAWTDYIPVALVDNPVIHAWTTNALGYIPFKALAGTFVSWLPTKLFESGEQGAWYDPSDLTTLFQDSAGTTPVTAVEQPVGLMLDKSGRGNHAFNTNATTVRPVLSARYSLLTYSEQFQNIAWIKGANQSLTTNTVSAPDGTVTADLLKDNSAGGTGSIVLYQNVTLASNQTYTFSVYLKNASLTQYAAIRSFNFDASANGFTYVDVVNGAIVSNDPQHISSVQNVGDGWYRFKITVTLGADNAGSFGVYLSQNGTNLTVDLDGTSGIYIWGADLRVANESATIPYQRVVTATDYDADPTKFPYYLRFDGSDDWLQTASIDFSGTDKMSVFAGVRKNTDSAVGIVAELSAAVTNAGSFAIYAPNAGANYAMLLNGSSLAAIQAATYTAPITNVLAVQYDIAQATTTTEIVARIDGATPSLSTTLAGPAGTGNFGNYAMYIGRRAGSLLPYNGRLYSLVVLGRTVTSTELTNTEGYVESKTFGKDMAYVFYENILGPDGEQLTLTAGGDDLYVYQNYE